MTLTSLIESSPYDIAINECISNLEKLKSVVPKSNNSIDSYNDMNDIIDKVQKKLEEIKDTINLAS